MESQYNLAWMYENGHGVTQDSKQAFDWYLKAALQGDAMAEYTIGKMYLYGKGIKQDQSQAQLWLDKACDKATNMRCDY